MLSRVSRCVGDGLTQSRRCFGAVSAAAVSYRATAQLFIQYAGFPQAPCHRAPLVNGVMRRRSCRHGGQHTLIFSVFDVLDVFSDASVCARLELAAFLMRRARWRHYLLDGRGTPTCRRRRRHQSCSDDMLRISDAFHAFSTTFAPARFELV
ncbi:hypothetical protein B0H15DRAFT_438073 [Mycena belliarum]|uniref:Uncharacterized protein n=1 Tax=Mycena belliarum TaxID=1033014 RepID=A0AAD6XNT4_9AGAR|nr:hypothetical protein B0H15DRAFT_438073 [Mycena belliae]